jgi:hypothetical protein
MGTALIFQGKNRPYVCPYCPYNRIVHVIKDCSNCQQYARTQEAPGAWRYDCRQAQRAFPHAWDCGGFQPTRWPQHGLTYVWDAEYEGAP